MKKYPAQIRYEKRHPVVSFRLDRELKKRLENVLEGKSFADFVKEGLGVREREKASLKKAHDEGYEEAAKEFGVFTRCTICGNDMIVRGERLKRALSRVVREQGWGHYTCMVERGERKEREREEDKARERERREVKREVEREARRLWRRKRRR